jgi:hypothetical protein
MSHRSLNEPYIIDGSTHRILVGLDGSPREALVLATAQGCPPVGPPKAY